MREIKVNSIYKHFKGDFIYVLDVAYNTETEEKYVIYKHRGKTWARPINMFLSEVDKEKYPDVKQKYRFEEVREEN